MSDLSGKFETLETQLSTQHTEILSALDSILIALGAPPETPVTTLDDILTAITATNTLLTAIQSDMNSYLLSIFNTLDTINTNASLNAQRLISTLLQTACPCDTTVPLLPPDLSTTPISATDLEKCQRIQLFLDLFRSWVITVGQYVGTTGSISSFQVDNLLQLALGDVAISTGELADGMPTAVRDTIVGQLASAVSAHGASAVDGGLFDAINSDSNLALLRTALYGVDNGAAGKPAADSAIDTFVADDWTIPIIKNMFYSSWANDIFGAVPIVDASAYDGSICSPIGPDTCSILDSVSDNVSFGGSVVTTRQAIAWPEPYDSGNTQPNGYTHSENVMLLGDYTGFRARMITGETCRIFGFNPAGAVAFDEDLASLGVGAYYTIVNETQSICIDAYPNNTPPISIEFCPPE